MKAIRIHFKDNGNELRVDEVSQLKPKAEEVMIRTLESERMPSD